MIYRSPALRKSAKGETCTLQIVGVCNHNPETTVLAHLPDESKGMGRKSDDFVACFACSSCHDFIDGRVGAMTFWENPIDENFYKRRALTRTWRRWIELGLIKLP